MNTQDNGSHAENNVYIGEVEPAADMNETLEDGFEEHINEEELEKTRRELANGRRIPRHCSQVRQSSNEL